MAFKGMGGPEMVGQLNHKREVERHTQQEAVLDQISRASLEELMEIQRSTAEKAADAPELLEDPQFNRVLNAIFRRAQVINGVNDKPTPESDPKVIH